MPQDNEIVGFTEPIAQALFDSVGIEERTFVQGRVRAQSSSPCKPPITDIQISGGWLQVSRDCGSTWENEIQLTTSCPEP